MVLSQISKLLIANRGEIACRVIRTARRLGIRTVAVYSDADAKAAHVEMADEAVRIGPAPVSESYLDAAAILLAARLTGADAIHPGYGFLSENPEFVEMVDRAGLIFVGSSAASIRAMGLKDGAKRLMEQAGVPIVRGYHGLDQDDDILAAEATGIGYPVLIKARAGGGGKGMRRVEEPDGFADALSSARREAKSSFGDDSVLIEKYVATPRHIEVQVFGDGHGNVVHLFERDCSLQRRHQKVIEEAPAPGMTDDFRAAITGAAVKAARAINYVGAGTIEFIADGSGPLRTDRFWFMEMNTRLQVEHPVTEAVTGQDLVEWQLRVAAGERLPLAQDEISISGHAFEARLYAEDPANGFLPQTGRVEHLSFSAAARNESGIRPGDTITPYYDPMISKIIVHAETRAAALTKFVVALGETHVAGTITNAGFLAALAAHEGFARGEVDTGLIARDLESLIATDAPTEVALFIGAMTALGIDLNAPLTGWRLWGDAEHRIRLECRGERFDRRLMLHGNGTASLLGDKGASKFLDVRRDGDRFSLRSAETRRRAVGTVAMYRVPLGKAVSVQMEGKTFEFVVADPLMVRREEGDLSDEVRATMTGTVIAVTAKAGDTVSKGDRLVALEAMKMETSLVAPRDGIVAEVRCSAGQTVEGGSVLIRLEARA